MSVQDLSLSTLPTPYLVAIVVVVVATLLLLASWSRKNGSTLRVANLYTYPVKSGAANQQKEAEIDTMGFKDDRRWMVVSAKTNRFISARECPKLQLMKSSFETKGERRHLVLSAPEMPTLVVEPSCITPEDEAKWNVEDVVVWSDKMKAVVCSPECHKWISDYLQMECRLIAAFDNTRHERPIKQKLDDISHEEKIQFGFADTCPFLLISEASLKDLQSKCPEPISMMNFRPNITVKGCDAYDEDHWKRIRIGTTEFNVAQACARCILTTVNPATGEKSKSGEPLMTMRKHRKQAGKFQEESACYFGVHLIQLTSGGKVREGDKVEVLERNL